MTQSSTLVKVIALLLMLLVGYRAWALIGLSQYESEIRSFAEGGNELSNGDLERLNTLAEDRDSFSDKQKTQFDTLYSRITRTHLDNSLVLSFGPDDSILLGKAAQAGGPVLGFSGATKLSVSLKEGAEQNDVLAGLEVNGSPLGKNNQSVSVAVPSQDNSKTHEVRIAASLGNGVKRDYDIQLRHDISPPQLRFLVTGRGLVDLDKSGRLGLKQGETVEVVIQDDTLIRCASIVDQASGKETKFVNEMTPRFQYTFDQGDGAAQFVVAAEDWAGNESRFDITFGKWRRPAPKIETVKLGDQDLLSTETAWSNSSIGDIMLTLEGKEEGHKIYLKAQDQKYKMLAESKGHKATAVNFGSDGTWDGDIILDQGDRQLSLQKIRVRVDQDGPTIQVIDEQKSDPKIAGAVDAKTGSTWSVRIEDNNELMETSVTASPESSMRISRKKTLSSIHEFGVKINSGGTLSISATDKAGNTTTRKLTFNIIAQLGPNDGKGPVVSLWHEGRKIPAEERVFFWGKQPKASLKIQDPSGIDVQTLKFERCTALSQTTESSATDITLPVHLSSDPLIRVSDAYGKETRRAFQVQVVSDRAEIQVDAADKIVRKLPFRFTFDIAEVVPAELVAIELVDPDGTSTPVTAGDKGFKNQGVIATLPSEKNGEWRLRLRFHAFDGWKKIAETTFQTELDKEKVE